MLEGDDLESLKQNLATYNMSSEISYDLGDRFRDAVPTRARLPIGITEKTTALYLRWLKSGYFQKAFRLQIFHRGLLRIFEVQRDYTPGSSFFELPFFNPDWHMAA